LRALARRHGINPKTVAKWRKRDSTADRRTGPTVPKSTVLSVEQEGIIVAFRKHTLLSLDDCLYALQATIPQLTRSSLHRCLERHGISRLPEVEGNQPRRKKFDSYPIGFVHIDLAEVRTTEGKLYLFVAIDRTSKFAVVQLVEKADVRAAADFLEALVEAVPYRIHTVLTDNEIQFADLPKNRQGPTARFRGHPFDRTCAVHGIEHRLTKPNHPWTNGQVERMNRTIKEATVKRLFYETHDQLKALLDDVIAAYNFARRLKTLRGLTPYETICKLWTQEPHRFTLDPIHQFFLVLGHFHVSKSVPIGIRKREKFESRLLGPTILLLLCFEYLTAEPILLFRTPYVRFSRMCSLWRKAHRRVPRRFCIN
jgi:transposase InsO family protein